MAAAARYPSPPEQMVALALQAREQGVPFEEWWETAVRPKRPPVKTSTPLPERPAGCVLWPSDSAARNEWRAATDGVRDHWGRAYDGLPQTPAEKALMTLVTKSPTLARLFMLPPPAPVRQLERETAAA